MSVSKLTFRLLIGLPLLGAGIWVAGAWLAAREISQPGRKALEEHHHAILRAPQDHGIRIESLQIGDGTPCLLCRPDPAARLDERGVRLRTQLQERGVVLSDPGVENGATLVLLHGRRGRKEDNLPVAVRFCAAGFRCLLLDLPGHGDHPQAVASYGPNEAGLPLAALEEAATHGSFPARPAGLWGISMGGSVAVHAAAAAPERWDALVVVASFDALAPVIRRQCEQRLGGTLGAAFHGTMKRFFNMQIGRSLDGIQPAGLAWQITTPALIVHGDDDPLIPAQAARRLFDALNANDKEWINVGAGTHGNVLVTPHPLYADMSAWLLRRLRATVTPPTTAPASPPRAAATR